MAERKAKVKLTYCRHATAYTATTPGGKPWAYLLIPATDVGLTHSWGWYEQRFRQ